MKQNCNEATSLATNCITENKSNDKGPDSVVAVVVESPTKESINSPSSTSQSKTKQTKSPNRQI